MAQCLGNELRLRKRSQPLLTCKPFNTLIADIQTVFILFVHADERRSVPFF